MHKGKLKVLNVYTRQEERSKNQWPYDTSSYLKNKRKSKHVVTRRKEIVRTVIKLRK